MRSRLASWAGIALLVSGVAAGAAPPAAQGTAVVPGALRRFGAVRVLRTLPGPPGMTAVLVATDGGQKAVVWVLGNGTAVATGQVWDAQGHDLTRAMAIRMGLIPRPSPPAAVAAAVARLGGFVLGTGGPEITLFLDPNCIFCHRLYAAATPLLAAGKLRLRVVMVGFLKPTSFARAGAILMAPDPARALAANERGFDVAAEEGGIAPAPAIPAPIHAAIVADTKLLTQSGAEATPTLLFQDRAGHWRILHHAPSEGLAALVAQLGG